MGRRRKQEHLRVGWFSASSRSSWLVGALRDSAPSRWTLSLFYLSLVGTCWEHHYLTRLTPPPFFSTRNATARGRFLLPLASAHFGSGCMLGHQLGCCSGFFWFFFIRRPFSFPSTLISLLLFYPEWCHSPEESDGHCQGDCMRFTWATAMPPCHTGRSQRSALSPTPHQTRRLGYLEVVSRCSVTTLS